MLLAVVWILCGLACARLGRYLDSVTFGSYGEAFAAGILMRIVGLGLIVLGVVRVIGLL